MLHRLQGHDDESICIRRRRRSSLRHHRGILQRPVRGGNGSGEELDGSDSPHCQPTRGSKSEGAPRASNQHADMLYWSSGLHSRRSVPFAARAGASLLEGLQGRRGESTQQLVVSIGRGVSPHVYPVIIFYYHGIQSASLLEGLGAVFGQLHHRHLYEATQLDGRLGG